MAAPASQYQPPPLSHPLPSPPQPSRPPLSKQISQTTQPTKTKTRSFSFRSDKSRNSIVNKIDLHETHAEKDARRLHSKADPTLAMNEAEPAEVAAMAATSIAPLRAIQHKDAYGNIIADPDKSNPTRNRWERPLDTIRSFEAAIEGDYVRRSMYRSDMDPAANYSRRNSYHRPNQPRFPQDHYYSSRAASFAGEGSRYGMTNPSTARNSYYENQNYRGGYHHGGSYHHNGYHGYQGPANHGPVQGRYPTHPPRTQSDPHYQSYGREAQRVYPLPHKDRSYETVTSAAASGSSDAVGYQTDPTSSDNSSIHRTSPVRPANDYDTGFNQSQSYKSPNLTPNFGSSSRHPLPSPPAPTYQTPPATVPRKQVAVLRRQPTQQQQPPQPAIPEKRKSWLARRFSKKS